MEKEMEKNKKKKNLQISRVSIWKICAYFIIYSFLGYVVETLFALFNYGVFECRQSFLYGPFCSIYGLGAVVIILALNYKFFKNNHTLFLGGFVVGSIVEYLVSLFGEMILNVKWWDYSNRFLNINGRICFLYSIFWGLLGVYLMRFINPKIDKFIDWLKKKIHLNILKTITTGLIIFLIIDCILSAYAINAFLIRVSIEKDLPVEHKEIVQQLYNRLYVDDDKTKFINSFLDDEKMLMTYPNLTVTLEDGSLKKIKEYYPEIKTYYYKFDLKDVKGLV